MQQRLLFLAVDFKRYAHIVACKADYTVFDNYHLMGITVLLKPLCRRCHGLPEIICVHGLVFACFHSITLLCLIIWFIVVFAAFRLLKHSGDLLMVKHAERNRVRNTLHAVHNTGAANGLSHISQIALKAF